MIPSKASAKISMRLVADQNPKEITALVKETLHKLTPASVSLEIIEHHHINPIVVDTTHPWFKSCEEAYEEVYNKKPIIHGEGGSIPIVSEFKTALGIDTLLMGLGLPDDNIHSPNEKMDLDMIEKGIQVTRNFYQKLK